MSEEYKFAQIKDPENCPIEELDAEVDRLGKLVDYYETKQLAIKKFINSVYGATASKYFIAHNTAVAESITLQGQDLNHYSENAVNEYFSGIFQNDTELHEKLGIDTDLAKKVRIDRGKITDSGPLTGEEFSYLNGNQSLTVAGDTDSQLSDTQVFIDNSQMTIENAFTKLKYENNDNVLVTSTGQEIIPVNNHTTLSYVDHSDTACHKPIKYIMRHKVNKSHYRIKSKSGKYVEITGDHSIMVIRNNELVSIPAKDLITNDLLITITGDKQYE